jgi:hypothetical protein
MWKAEEEREEDEDDDDKDYYYHIYNELKLLVYKNQRQELRGWRNQILMNKYKDAHLDREF